MSKDFFRGVITSLAVLKGFGMDTIYEEIIKTVGEDELVRIARSDGAMRWSGLSGYRRLKRQGAGQE